MASKKSDDKAIVSFSSDSDEDDSSSSSRLSSSASSGEDSEVETVTFSVPFPSSGQALTQGAAVGAKEESKSKTRSETKKAEPVKAVSPEPRKSPVAEAKEKSPLRRTTVTEEVSSKKEPNLTKDKLATSDSIKELRKSPGKQEEIADKLKVTKRAENSVSSERAKSPKIIVNDVDEEPPRQTKKSSENDVTLTSSKIARKSPEIDVTVTSSKATNKIRGASPKKTSDDAEAELPLLSSKSMKDGGRAVSPREEKPAEDLGEVTKTTKRSSKLTAERTKSPKDTEEEPASISEVKTTDRAKSPKKTAVDKDVERAKSPKQILEENDSERAKSPKKTLDTKDAERAKSPKKTLEEQVAERAKSPKKTAEDEENVERAKSPKTSAKDGGEAKKKSNKDSSKTPYELLRSAESPEKSPTRSTKSKKSLTAEEDSTTPKRKSPLKDLEGKELETGDTPDAVDPVKPKKASKKTARSIVSDEVDLSKAEVSKKDEIGVSEAKVTDSSDTANEVEQLLKEIRQKRISQMANQPDLESETTPEGGSKLIRVTVDEAGKTDDAALKTPNSEQNDAEVKDKDYMKVTSSSTNPANEAPGSKPELENEESEFTYRRKSMDDFIKRILAEAKEERLKQKHGGGSANETTEDEKKAGVDRYAERNGDITENGLDRTKWSNGESSEDREGSMLDRRLAKIEKRRFGGSSDAEKGEGVGEKEGGRSKVGKETEEEGTTNRTTKSAKDPKDFDVNLDEDLEEINRFLQSRKTAASRFDFDEPGQNDDATTTTPTKRRWATGKEQPQQQPEEEDLPSPGSRSQIKKKYSADLDFNEDDERYLGRFKRDRDSTLERDSALPEESFSPRRRNETDEVVRERTRNVRVLVDQQVEIVQAMRTTSKSLDELEKEIREVRQVCLNRQARIEALEGALGAEYRAFENDQLAATDRQKSTEGLNSKEDFGMAGFGRLRRQDKFKSESLDEENFPFRRRSGSVSSTTSYTSGFDGRGRLGDGGNDAVDSRPPSGLKQSRDPRRTSETESDFSAGLDRRRGGSAARDRTSDLSSSSFGPDDMTFLSQRPARSRASIATSNPAVDYAGTISGDSFLAKIRAKYSFLAPTIDNQSYSSSIRSNSGISSSYASPSSLTYGSKRLGSRDILTSSSPYSSLGTGVGGYGGYSTTGGGRYSITDTRSYGTGGFLNSSGISGISSSYGDSGRMRRAQSVSEVSFDRSITSPTNLGSSGGGEFHSRFLDKVRGKKAMAEDASSATTSSATTTTTTTKGQEKPFKSRFLKTTSFDAGSSRSDRLTNGFEDGDDVGEHRRGVPSEINGNA